MKYILSSVVLITLKAMIWITPVHAQVTLFVDPTVGIVNQAKQEAAFQAAVSGTTMINFDDVDTGPVVGTEWTEFGVSFSPLPGGGIVLRASDENVAPHSVPNALWSSDTIDAFEFTLTPPKNAVGFWLVDSETNVGDDNIMFFDSENQLISEVPMPATEFITNGHDANFFIGIESDVAIARVTVNEQLSDTESVGIDNLQILSSVRGNPTPSNFIQPSSGDFFMASANGSQQVTVPPGGVNTDATCLATFRVVGDAASPTLRYRVQCFGIIGVTQAHIHLGRAQGTGEVAAFLFPLGDSTGPVDGLIRRGESVSQGILTDTDLQGDLAGTTISELIDILHADAAYLNVHTEENPGGEVRGQILPVENVASLTEEFYFANASGSQVVTGEIDGVESDASCTGSFRPSNAELVKFKVRCYGITGVTQITMHIGSPQENGGVAAVLFPDGIPSETANGVIKREGGKSKGNLTSADVVGTTVSGLIDSMRAGRTYINVLTEAHPDGEVRGQVVRMDALGGGF